MNNFSAIVNPSYLYTVMATSGQTRAQFLQPLQASGLTIVAG
jgi:hypothetical protein